ncbi:hypothetical protein PVK06_043907 [Gossypium arboreum]|uniref:Uncharacterized protein n=1 Tax=Gossypium arboreum TaxID=29729 RepID=A0ABR0MPN1_GOSAR|nr:hypothetical protein PVK06_043907 [Gossypium arboreum]
MNQTPKKNRHGSGENDVAEPHRFAGSNSENSGTVSEDHGNGGNNNFELEREAVGERGDDKHGGRERKGVGDQENTVVSRLGCINGSACTNSILPYSARRVDTGLEGNGSYEGCYY